MITKRDRIMLCYLEQYEAARTTSLLMFYNDIRTCQRRLKILHDTKKIGRYREDINSEYIYYIKKPKQLRHRVILTDFLREFSKITDIKSCKNKDVQVGHIRPDAVIGYVLNGKKDVAFVEIQISNLSLDTQKYEKLYYSGAWKEIFPVFPQIIAVTDRKIPETELKVIKVNEDLSNLEEGFK